MFWHLQQAAKASGVANVVVGRTSDTVKERLHILRVRVEEELVRIERDFVPLCYVDSELLLQLFYLFEKLLPPNRSKASRRKICHIFTRTYDLAVLVLMSFDIVARAGINATSLLVLKFAWPIDVTELGENIIEFRLVLGKEMLWQT